MKSERRAINVGPARIASFDILERVEAEGAFASVALASLEESSLSREDRALAHEVTLGVLRWQSKLDYLIERYSGRQLSRLDLAVVIALRMGLYQIRYLSRIPHSAAVNEAVNLVKRARKSSAAGLVNAVLRSAVKRAGEEPWQEIEDPLQRLSIEVSHPAWLLERWMAVFGRDQARELALANNQPAPVAFRVNTLRAKSEHVLASLQSQGISLHTSRFAPDAFVVDGGPPLASTPEIGDGLIYIQDEASQLVSLLLDPQRGDRILDACAAPGSKTSHIGALAQNDCWIVGCELHPRRLTTLVSTCSRLGVTSVDAVAVDLSDGPPFIASARFDRVLVDAPCTGTGTLRQNPEIKWRLKPLDPARLSELQLKLLRNAAQLVKPGGTLVYSTCSIEQEENESVIEQFLAEESRYRLTPPETAPELVTELGFVRTFPHKQRADGFFVAVLTRVNDVCHRES